jgi:bifunctional non-homologous end joining protein LigD
LHRPIFNVQKHKASTLHYDFRLEVEGVLRSWAIPKGPSLDPTIKRLALLVEDHDLSHANAEGVLGSRRIAIIWDSGWFEDVGASAKVALENGVFDFVLHGQRLKGRFSLVKVKRRKRDWLLIKREDNEARVGFEVTTYYQTSILSGKRIEDFEKSQGL